MIYIRVDMNDIIATGHLMRCLAIADAARERGIETTFILADENSVSLLEEKKYRYIILHTKWDDMDGELATLISVIETEKIDKLFIDSYMVTATYLKALTNKTYTIYLDDLNAFTYPVNAIVCYASYHQKFHYLDKYKYSEQKTRIYEGCQYTPLRREFKELPEKLIKENIDNVLILSGGTDPFNAIEQLLRIIREYDFKNVYAICGKYNNKYDNIRKTYQSNCIQILKSVDNIFEYMIKADLVISAGGTTLYELCSCGTPAISYAIADNQLENVKQFNEDGLIAYVGDIRNENININLRKSIMEYNSQSERRKRSKKMQNLIDGDGCERIVQNVLIDIHEE